MKFNRVVTLGLIYSQLHSAWTSAPDTCVVFNTESSKLVLLVTLVTDIVLLLIMLAGLLLQLQYGDMPGVRSLLLKQVGGGALPWP
jgi:hypothetical protein